MKPEKKSPEEEFVLGETGRSIYLNRAVIQANLTYPTCCPPPTADPPVLAVNQPCGKDITDRLINQLMSALFPATAPIGLVVLPQGADPATIAKAAELEAAATQAFWESKLPLAVTTFLRMCVVCSDALAVVDIKGSDPKKWKARTYPFRDYIKLIDKSGALVTAITRDFLSVVETENGKHDAVLEQVGVRKYIKYIYEYTRYDRVPGTDQWLVSTSETNQQWDGVEEKVDYCPVLHLEWIQNHAGSYGVDGPIAQVVQDLMQLSQLYHALSNQLDGASKALVGVGGSAGATTAAAIRTSDSGDTVPAERDTVFPIMLYDVQAVQLLGQEINTKTQLIEKLLGIPSVVRDGERVTATEVEMVTQAKVGKYGAFYLQAEDSLVRPIVNRIFNQIQKNTGVIKATSGYATSQQLPRAQALTTLLQTITAAEADESPLFKETLSRSRFIATFAHSLNLNLSTCYLTDKELQEAEQKAQETKIQDAAIAQAQAQPLQPQPLQ